jgi:hypothetical protein
MTIKQGAKMTTENEKHGMSGSRTKLKEEPECWMVNFIPEIPVERYDKIVEYVTACYPSGCYQVVKPNGGDYQIHILAEGKTNAHIKRRAAQNNDAEWVRYTRFVVIKEPVVLG